MWYKQPVKNRIELMRVYKKYKPDMSYFDMVNDYNNAYKQYAEGGKVPLTAGGEKHLIYKKESPTGNGEGIKGHIMVNHPTTDKGKWDTIDLTEITNYKVKTVQQGIDATKKWHAENPEYTYGGMQDYGLRDKNYWGEMSLGERTGYLNTKEINLKAKHDALKNNLYI